MLCCLGLFVGFAIGSMLGGPWIFIAPAIGFGLGFMGDRKLMRGSHGGHEGYGGGCCGGGHMHSKKVEKSVRDDKNSLIKNSIHMLWKAALHEVIHKIEPECSEHQANYAVTNITRKTVS